MNTNYKGEMSEAKALSRLVELGYTVSIPWGGSSSYDFIIEKDGMIERVQVKTARLVYDDSSISFNCNSQHLKEGKYIKTNYIGKADRFVVYCPQINELYTILVNDAPKRECLLRIKPVKRLSKATRWAKDFIL